MNSERPRSYRFPSRPEFADRQIGLADGGLEESAERLIDLIGDLDGAALHRVPDELADPIKLSIARLVKHLVWAEVNWVGRLSGTAPAPELLERCSEGALDTFGDRPGGTETAEELCDLIRSMRRYSSDALRPLAGLDTAFEASRGPRTTGEVLMHLLWHWAYHTGQIGLLRDMAGLDYTWRFEA